MSLNHLAIIMDGNRRWALSNNFKSFEGHLKGAENLWQIVKDVEKKKNKLSNSFCFFNRKLEKISS